MLFYQVANSCANNWEAHIQVALATNVESVAENRDKPHGNDAVSSNSF